MQILISIVNENYLLIGFFLGILYCILDRIISKNMDLVDYGYEHYPIVVLLSLIAWPFTLIGIILFAVYIFFSSSEDNSNKEYHAWSIEELDKQADMVFEEKRKMQIIDKYEKNMDKNSEVFEEYTKQMKKTGIGNPMIMDMIDTFEKEHKKEPVIIESTYDKLMKKYKKKSRNVKIKVIER